MRLLHDRHVDHSLRNDEPELWETGSGAASGEAGGEVVKLIASYHLGCGRSATAHNRALAVRRIDLRQRPPTQRLRTWRARCVPDICGDFETSNQPRIDCLSQARQRGSAWKNYRTVVVRVGFRMPWPVLGQARVPLLFVSLFLLWKVWARTDSGQRHFWRRRASSPSQA